MKYIWDLNELEKKIWSFGSKRKKIEFKEFDFMVNIFKRYSFL